MAQVTSPLTWMAPALTSVAPSPVGAMQGEFELPEGLDRPPSREEADAFREGKR